MLGVDPAGPTSRATDLLTQLVSAGTPSEVDAPKTEVYKDDFALMERLRRQAAHRILGARRAQLQGRHPLPKLPSSSPPITQSVIDVFTAGETNEHGEPVSGFRIPGLAVGSDRVLLVTAEARMESAADIGPHDLAIRRSVDSGRSWLPLQTIVRPKATFGPSEDGGIVTDPVPVYDSNHDNFHIAFGYVPSRFVHYDGCRQRKSCNWGTLKYDISEPGARELYIVSSQDIGETWSSPRNLSGLAVPGEGKWCGLTMGGGGSGVQLTRGPHTGRLLLAGYHGCCACMAAGNLTSPDCLYSHLLLSDDGGRSFRLTEEFFPGSAEGSLAELPTPGHLVFVSRLERESHCTTPPGGAQAPSHCAGKMYSTDSVSRIAALTMETVLSTALLFALIFVRAAIMVAIAGHHLAGRGGRRRTDRPAGQEHGRCVRRRAGARRLGVSAVAREYDRDLLERRW